MSSAGSNRLLTPKQEIELSIKCGYYQDESILRVLSSEYMTRLRCENAEHEYYHQFVQQEKNYQRSFHILQDIKDIMLEHIHAAGANLFYNNLELANIFKLWRHLVIMEGRYTLWDIPKNLKELSYTRLYHPFYLYRDLWAALLAPYWDKNLLKTQEEHIRQTVARYFARLLHWHPCRVLYCCENWVWEEELDECGQDTRFCSACCRKGNYKVIRKGGKKQIDCSEQCIKKESMSIDQSGCKSNLSLDVVLIAALGDCIWKEGGQKGNATEPFSSKAKDLLDELFRSVMEPAAKLDGKQAFAFWLFLSDFLLEEERCGVAGVVVPSWIEETNKRIAESLQPTKDRIIDEWTIRSYASTLRVLDVLGDGDTLIKFADTIGTGDYSMKCMAWLCRRFNNVLSKGGIVSTARSHEFIINVD